MPQSLVVSVVLGTFNRIEVLKLTIDSIRKELVDVPHEIIVVDGGSTDGTLRWLAAQKDLVTIIQHNRGVWNNRPIERRSWGYFMNLGFKCAQGKYICMVSDDCLIVPGAIVNGCRLFDDELARGSRVGAVAFYWRNWPEQRPYVVGTTLGDKMFVNHGLYLRSALDEVGFIDEVTYFFYHADGDLCLKLWDHNYTVIASPDSYVEHCSHINPTVRASNNRRQQQDWNNYVNKWQNTFDPGVGGGWLEKHYDDPAKSASKLMVPYWKSFAINFPKRALSYALLRLERKFRPSAT